MIGNPNFVKGNKEAVGNRGGGRKGYDIEHAQLERMRKVLDRDLKMIEKLQNSKKINLVEEKKISILQARVLKIYDKLHASKQETDIKISESKVFLID